MFGDWKPVEKRAMAFHGVTGTELFTVPRGCEEQRSGGFREVRTDAAPQDPVRLLQVGAVPTRRSKTKTGRGHQDKS